MHALNYRDDITAEGLHFAHAVCEAHSDFDELNEVLEGYESKKFTGGSGGRVICEFPDEFLRDGARYLDNQHHETFFVLKACYRPNPQNYKEVQIWDEAQGTSSSDLFAPLHAWDGSYRWVLMKRVTPVSPARTDLAYTQTGQEYYHMPEAIDRIEEWLNEEGWDVVDADENTAFHEEQEYLCLMDYGGVSPQNGSIDYPDWVTA